MEILNFELITDGTFMKEVLTLITYPTNVMGSSLSTSAYPQRQWDHLY